MHDPPHRGHDILEGIAPEEQSVAGVVDREAVVDELPLIRAGCNAIPILHQLTGLRRGQRRQQLGMNREELVVAAPDHEVAGIEQAEEKVPVLLHGWVAVEELPKARCGKGIVRDRMDFRARPIDRHRRHHHVVD